MKRNVMMVFALILLIFSSSFSATRSDFQAGIQLFAGFPQNEFKENMDNTGFGLSGEFLYRLNQSPFLVGGGIGFLIYGYETRKVPFNQWAQEVTVDVTTSNSIFMGHLIARLQPPTGTIRPYVDGLIGFNYFSTETKIESENWDDDEDDRKIASSTNSSDGTFSYGGGLAIKMYDNDNQEEMTSPFAVFVDIDVHYIQGCEAEYLKEGSITHYY